MGRQDRVSVHETPGGTSGFRPESIQIMEYLYFLRHFTLMKQLGPIRAILTGQNGYFFLLDPE